ncbi:Rv3235 family protein [Actinomyces ruminicola]|uniref:Rv3235 family protein n=1 Tax=Actinomyces ruminicola TaxID=332524 RepID=UPI001C9CAB3B|nr:Rv3235 family protein [Actinomyces ruminicola]
MSALTAAAPAYPKSAPSPQSPATNDKPQLRAVPAPETIERPGTPPRSRTRPAPAARTAPGLRLSASTPAGTLVPRPVLDGAQQPKDWDRLRFRPVLKQGGDDAKQPNAEAEMPDPARFAAVVVTAAAEVLSGHRRADNLARWTTPELFEALTRRAGLACRLLGQAPTRLRPRSAHAQPPKHGSCEVTVLLDDGTRVRAAAARLETFRGRWLLAALEIA